nr:MAG TPA: hypothetical protein [Caudoviricetes sp.]
MTLTFFDLCCILCNRKRKKELEGFGKGFESSLRAQSDADRKGAKEPKARALNPSQNIEKS